MPSTTRILVVEDNAINQKVAQLTLQREGYKTVDVVGDGSQAVNACGARNYDVVLMDCQMPVMDGLEATQLIRRLEKDQPIIIAVTAHALVDDRKKCLESGMNDYLSKPYKPGQLLQIVRDNLERPQ